MTRGLPDWFNVLSSGRNEVKSDIAELAVRSGSIARHGISGNIFWQDGFEGSPNPYIFSATGTGATAGVVNTTAYSGSSSVQLVSGTVSTNVTTMTHYAGHIDYSVTGIDIKISTGLSASTFWALLRYDDGVTNHEALIRYSGTSKTWHYVNSDGTLIPFITKDITANVLGKHFYRVKLTADFVNKNYAYVIIGNNFFPLANVPLRELGSAAGAGLFIVYQIQSSSALSQTAFLDEYIITHNEPIQ